MWDTSLALLFLAAGYMFVSRWIITRSIALRSSEHPQYFHAAIAGAVIYVLASLTIASLKVAAPCIQSVASKLSNALAQQLVISSPDPQIILRGIRLFAAAATLAWLLPYFLNIPLRRNPRLVLSILERSGAQTNFERLVARSLGRLPLMLTQDSGKVYVGYVVGEDARTMDLGEWVRIEPFLSGYRDDCQNFLWTTDYMWLHDVDSAKVLETIGRQKSDFDVLIPSATIVSAHTFDFTTYSRLFAKTSPDQTDRSDGAEQASAQSPESPKILEAHVPAQEAEERQTQTRSSENCILDWPMIQLVLYLLYCSLVASVVCLPAILGTPAAVACLVAGALCARLLDRSEKPEGES